MYASKEAIVDKALNELDLSAWERLGKHYADLFSAHGEGYHPDKIFRLERNYSKYFELDRWLTYHARNAMSAGLHAGVGRKRVLDLGCGSGMFLYICRVLGHEGIGLDLGSQMYQEMAEVFGVEYRISPILAHQKLPEDLTGFDVVSALAIKFDRHDWGPQGDEPWSLPEWQFFLQDTASRLNPEGKLLIKPNYWIHPTENEPGVYFKDERVLSYLTELSEVVTPSYEFLIPGSAVVAT